MSLLAASMPAGALALALLASACAPLGQFTAGDAANAAWIDPSGASCYQAIGAIGASTGGVTQDRGLLTAIATKRAVKGALQGSDCAPLEADILGEILKATPAAPLVP